MKMTTTGPEDLVAHGGVRVYIRTPEEQYDAAVLDLLNRIAQFSIDWDMDVAEESDVLAVDVRDSEDVRQWADGHLPDVVDAYAEPNYISFKRKDRADVS